MWSPSKPKKAAFWCLKYLCHHLVLKFYRIWILRVVQWQVCEQLRSPCSRLSTRTRGSKASISPAEDFYSGFMWRLFRTFAWIFESVWSCSNFTAVNTHTHTSAGTVMLLADFNEWWLRYPYFSIWMHFRDTLRYSSAFTARKQLNDWMLFSFFFHLLHEMKCRCWIVTFKNKLCFSLFQPVIRWIVEKPVIHP